MWYTIFEIERDNDEFIVNNIVSSYIWLFFCYLINITHILIWTVLLWLSNDFIRQYYFLRQLGIVSKVIIPCEFRGIIENDKDYGYKYELIEHNYNTNDNTNKHIIFNNNIKYDTYWKWQTHNKCMIYCNRHRHRHNTCTRDKSEAQKNSKKNSKCICCSYSHSLILMMLPLLLLIVPITCECSNYSWNGINYSDTSLQLNDSDIDKYYKTVFTIEMLICLITSNIMIGIEFKYNRLKKYSLIDIYHISAFISSLYLIIIHLINVMNVLQENSYTYSWFLDSKLIVIEIIFTISCIYFLFVSPIARYTMLFMLIWVAIGVNIQINTIENYNGMDILRNYIEDALFVDEAILYLWSTILFSLITIVLYVKLNHKRKDKSGSMYQLNQTIGGIFAALFDYATDLVVIIFWWNSQFYMFAIFEILFIFIAQLVIAVNINNIYIIDEHVNNNGSKQNNNNNNDNKNCHNNNNKSGKIPYFVRCLFCLGFGRLYFSIIAWNENELIKSQYKMCKIWEMLFESMPSVALSTYALLVNSINDKNSNNTSVLLSMFFSFINMTNTIVNIIDTDTYNNSKNNNSNNNSNNNISNDRNSNNCNINDNAEMLASIHDINNNNNNKVRNDIQLVEPNNTPETDTSLTMPIDSDTSVDIILHNDCTETGDSKVCNRETDNPNNNKVQVVCENILEYDSNLDDIKNESLISFQNQQELQNKKISYWFVHHKTNKVTFFKEQKYISNNDKKRNTSKKEKYCHFSYQFFKSMIRFEFIKINNIMLWILLTSDLFIKILSLILIILMINYNNSNYSNNNVVNNIICCGLTTIFLLFILIVEYFCLKFLLSTENNCDCDCNIHAINSNGDICNKCICDYINNIDGKPNKTLIFQYIFVNTFTISYYTLIIIGTKYIPKLVDKKKTLIKYQSFKLLLCLAFVGIFLLAQFIFSQNIMDINISVSLFIVFFIVFVIHLLSLSWFYCHL